MAEFGKSIAHEAHGLVHGERAKTYGHPRFDFTAIGKVWTGLLQDVLKEGVVLDAYRVAILMTGLKLCRLVKSPDHHDSRVDTIGYMLTMERLDEPEEEPLPLSLINKPLGRYNVADIKLMEKFAEEELARADAAAVADDDIDDGDYDVHGRTVDYDDHGRPLEPDEERISWETTGQAFPVTFNELKLWFEPEETKYVNGAGIKNTEKTGRIIVIPLAPDTHSVLISPHPPAASAEEVREMLDPPDSRPEMKVTADLSRENLLEVNHNHLRQEPCIPPCPVWANGRPKFEFTGEQVEMKPSTPWERND